MRYDLRDQSISSEDIAFFKQYWNTDPPYGAFCAAPLLGVAPVIQGEFPVLKMLRQRVGPRQGLQARIVHNEDDVGQIIGIASGEARDFAEHSESFSQWFSEQAGVFMRLHATRIQRVRLIPFQGEGHPGIVVRITYDPNGVLGSRTIVMQAPYVLQIGFGPDREVPQHLEAAVRTALRMASLLRMHYVSYFDLSRERSLHSIVAGQFAAFK